MNTGQSVTWVAPSSPSSGVTITCTISDAAVIPPGETGNRNDTNVQRSVAVKVYAVDWIKITEVNGTAYPTGFTGSKIYVRTTGAGPSLKVKAKVTPAISGATVYWSYEDPDEPSGYVPDDTDANGNDNAGLGAGFGTSSSTTDANGETPEVTFTGTDCGGDNFILCASPRSNDGPYKKTQTLTQWKKIAFELEDALNGYSAAPGNIDGELTNVYVERVTTSGTGDTIPTNDQYLTDNGAYGPNSIANRDSQAQDYDDDPTTDYQLITTRSEAAVRNKIETINKEPYGSGTNYVFGTVASGAIDFDDQGDMDLSEAWTTGEARTNSPRRINIYRDNISIDAKLLNVTEANRLKRTLWHEVGHALGLGEGGDGNNSIMNQIPFYSSQDNINTAKSRIDNMHWSDTEGALVRLNYTPNAE